MVNLTLPYFGAHTLLGWFCTYDIVRAGSGDMPAEAWIDHFGTTVVAQLAEPDVKVAVHANPQGHSQVWSGLHRGLQTAAIKEWLQENECTSRSTACKRSHMYVQTNDLEEPW